MVQLPAFPHEQTSQIPAIFTLSSELLVRVGLGLGLAALSYLCTVFVINFLAQDACLDAGGKLEAGNICVLPNMATRSNGT